MNKKEFKTKVFKRIVESIKQDENGIYVDDSLDNAFDKKLKSSTENLSKEDPEAINQLTSKFATLVSGFHDLIDVKNLLLKKVLNHANKNFSREVAKKIKDALEDQYDLSLKEKDSVTAPPAVGAGNSPSQ